MNELLDNIPCSIAINKDENGMKKLLIQKKSLNTNFQT